MLKHQKSCNLKPLAHASSGRKTIYIVLCYLNCSIFNDLMYELGFQSRRFLMFKHFREIKSHSTSSITDVRDHYHSSSLSLLYTQAYTYSIKVWNGNWKNRRIIKMMLVGHQQSLTRINIYASVKIMTNMWIRQCLTYHIPPLLWFESCIVHPQVFGHWEIKLELAVPPSLSKIMINTAAI